MTSRMRGKIGISNKKTCFIKCVFHETLKQPFLSISSGKVDAAFDYLFEWSL